MNLWSSRLTAGLATFIVLGSAVQGLALTPALAAELTSFKFRTSYKGVKTDPEKIWLDDDLVATGRAAEIHEYMLALGKDVLLVSQVWNDNCSIAVCPTRLVKIADGKTTLLVDDMMHPIVPPGEPIANTPAASDYQAHPFRWDAGAQALHNGDFTFSARK